MMTLQFLIRNTISLNTVPQTLLRRGKWFQIQQQVVTLPIKAVSTISRSRTTLSLSSGSQTYNKQIEQYNVSTPGDLYRPYYQLYYNDVYEVPLPPKHRFPMSKYRQVRERIQDKIQNLSSEEIGGVQINFKVSPLVTKTDLLTTHCEKYVERYLIGDQTELELRNVGFPWSPEGVNRSLSSTGGTVAAALSICNAKREQLMNVDQDDSYTSTAKYGPLFAAHIAGGTHHAFKDRGEGFSVFSDIAVAANVVLRDFPDIVSRVLIIDLDVHQGNGNAVLFQDEKRVFTFSMHCKGNYFSAKENSDLDIELPIGCNDETYLSTLHHWLRRIRNEAGKFDLIFFQAGVDILGHDRLGRMNLSAKGSRRRNNMVYKFALEMGVPMVITMGGGYPKKDWESILSAHTDVYISAFENMKDF